MSMQTHTLTTTSDLPSTTLRAAAPLTLDEATAWGLGIGAAVIYWLPKTRTAFASFEPAPTQETK